MLALDYTYVYPRASTATPDGVVLSTTRSDLFFHGHLVSPRRTADQLLLLARVVASRFHVPPAMLGRILRQADPVITCGLDCMRWEGFSACASVYARLDLLPPALDGALLTSGCTNVDFGPELRAALTRLNEHCAISVGAQALDLAQVVERRVSLPVRWLKGFVECQAHQAQMELCHEISGTEARRFLAQLPRQDASGYVAAAGKGLRCTQLPTSVTLNGSQRLRLLEDVIRHALKLRVYANSKGASAWEAITTDSRFHLVLSPEPYRGFSGEGQSIEERNPESGYDLHQRAWFHRPLPYDYQLLDKLHPRLEAARKLAVDWEGNIAWVKSADVSYRVVLEDGGCRCNCTWFARHGTGRGPCKHILAAQLALTV